ncbi:MAG: FAD-dependent oxidoreductase [Myxococcales bacterium]|nr:FAD-dependent oxidoreductase [Myxococcales bacterium]
MPESSPCNLSASRSENVFEDFKPAYDEKQALVEANRCLYCFDAPCQIACPTHIDIAGFIRKIATGNDRGAARTILDANIFGMSCARVCPVEVLCVGECVHNHQDVPPIAIGRLQRYATDRAVEEGWQFFEAGASTGKKVAMIGGGPASLAAAHQLRRHGHSVTIFEARERLGGLNTNGVAPYKLRADTALAEVDYVLAIGGIEVRTSASVGGASGPSLADLERDHDAVFVGAGLGADSGMDVPSADLAGIYGAVAFIEAFKTGVVDLSGVTHAAVIGGGNTAVDCVRELLGLGIPVVSMVYRGDESRMSGYSHEWDEAKVEGGRGVWRAMPVGFEGVGRVTGVRCAELDADKKVLPGRELTVPAQVVLLAIGQSKLGSLLAGLDGVELQNGRIVVDATGATGRPGFYAGGDCANGGKEVVNAVAEGKAAANGIHVYLTTPRQGRE